MLIRPAPRAASCEFTVNDDSGDAAQTVILRFGRRFGLMHVVDHDLVRRTDNPFDEVDRFFACGTSRAENFYLLLCGHGVLLKNLLDFLLTAVGTGFGIVRGPGEATYSRAKQLPVGRSRRIRWVGNPTRTCLAERCWPRVLPAGKGRTRGDLLL